MTVSELRIFYMTVFIRRVNHEQPQLAGGILIGDSRVMYVIAGKSDDEVAASGSEDPWARLTCIIVSVFFFKKLDENINQLKV